MGTEVIDNFLDDFEGFREHCDNVNYDGVVNPVDNVFYPGVSDDIPDEIRKEIISKLNELMGRDVKVNFMFLRLSDKTMKGPHQAHTDSIMGTYSLMLYLNRIEDCEGGTSLVMHKRTGLSCDPINEKQLLTWETDTNNPDAWNAYSICPMLPNRGFVFNANLMHRAEPVGGFGNNAKDGRLVLTVFYD